MIELDLVVFGARVGKLPIWIWLFFGCRNTGESLRWIWLFLVRDCGGIMELDFVFSWPKMQESD